MSIAYVNTARYYCRVYDRDTTMRAAVARYYDAHDGELRERAYDAGQQRDKSERAVLRCRCCATNILRDTRAMIARVNDCQAPYGHVAYHALRRQ